MTKDQTCCQGEGEMEKRKKRINTQIPAHAKALICFFPTSEEDGLNQGSHKATRVKMTLCVFLILQSRPREAKEGEFSVVKHAQK